MRVRIVRLSVVAAVAFCGAGLSHAQVLIDDFPPGGDLSDWTRMGTLPKGGGPGIFEIVNGEYNIRSTGPVPPDITANWLLSTWAPSSTDAIYSNGTLRAKIRNNVSKTDTVLAMRGNLGSNAAYYFVASSSFTPPRALLARASNGVFSFLPTPEVSFPFDNLMDWNIEAGVVGNRVSMKVWPDGAPEPTTPQLNFTDPTPLPDGMIGVGTWNNANNDSSFPLDAAIEDIYFTPIPTGDYNGNGRVEQADLDLVLLNWGVPDSPIPEGWVNDLPTADFIDQDDLDRVLLNWGNTSAATGIVPEPGNVMLLLAGVVFAFLARRRIVR